MFCKKCGAKLEENINFCTSCGTEKGTSGNNVQTASDNRKLYKILAYIPLLFLVGMFVKEKDDKSVKFHVGQGILSTIIVAAIAIINNLVVFNIFTTETWFGVKEVSSLGYLISGALYLAGLAFCIIGIVNVAKDEDKELPFVGKYAFYK